MGFIVEWLDATHGTMSRAGFKSFAMAQRWAEGNVGGTFTIESDGSCC